jgi:hypothetical protein
MNLKAKRLGTGYYEYSGTTTLDGVQASVVYRVWKHEEIKGCWLIDTEINGRSLGDFSDFAFKDSAVKACRIGAELGYRTVKGLGICLN